MKAYMQSLSSSGMVHQGCRSVAESGPVANWMGGEGGDGGIHYLICRSFGLSADGDGEFLVFVNVVPVGNDSFGSGIRQVVASDVCVSPNLCSIVVSSSSVLYRRESTIAAMSGL